MRLHFSRSQGSTTVQVVKMGFSSFRQLKRQAFGS